MNTTTTPPQFPADPGRIRELSCERQNANLDLDMPQIPEDLIEAAKGDLTPEASSDLQQISTEKKDPDRNESESEDRTGSGAGTVPEREESRQESMDSEMDPQEDFSDSAAEKTESDHPKTDQSESVSPESEKTQTEQNSQQKTPSDAAEDHQPGASDGALQIENTYAFRPAKPAPEDDSLKGSQTNKQSENQTEKNKQNAEADGHAGKKDADGKENSETETAESESGKEQISGPVIQVLQKDRQLQIILREDVDPALSILKWNSKKVETGFLDLDASIRNHLTYELRNSAGEVLESSEQFFEAADDLREDPEKQPQVIRNQLGIYQSMNYSIPDQHQKKNLKVTLDGVFTDPSDIRISRSNRLIRAEYLNEWNETVIEEIEIRPLGQIEQDLSNPAAMVIENGVMKITLNGDWQGMSLVMKTAGQQDTWLPFESGCLQIRLNPGQSYQFSLSHALLQEQVSWNIEAGSWTDDSSLQKPESDDKNQQESVQPPALNRPSAPQPSAPSDSVKPAEMPSAGSITTVIAGEESYSSQLSKPLEQMKFEFSIDGIALSNQQIFQLSENSQEKVRIENGTITSTVYSNSLTSEVYSTLDDAVRANPLGSIEACFTVKDLWGNEQESSYSLIPPVREASGLFEMNTGGVMNKFALDENGNLNQEALEFASRPGMICKGLADAGSQKIRFGDEIRIYLTIPEEEALIRINDEELHNPEYKTDELGLRYVSLNADQDLDIEVHSTRTRQKIAARIQPEKPARREVTLEFSGSASPVQGLMHAAIGLLTGLFMEGKRRFGWPL